MEDSTQQQRGSDVPVGACLATVQDTERFTTYCSRPDGHTGPCSDGTHSFEWVRA